MLGGSERITGDVLAYAAGAGMTAGYVTQQLFCLPYRGRGAR